MSRSLHGYNINLAPGWEGGWHYSVGCMTDAGIAILIQTGSCTDYDVATKAALKVVQDDRSKHKETES